MKHLFFFALFLLSLDLTAQEIRIDLDNFSEVEVSRGLTVNFTLGEENTAVITGSSRDKVQVKVEKGVLIIRSSLNQLLNSDNTLVNITYKQLQQVKARQNSSVEFCAKIHQPMIKFRASEGAEIFANVEVEDLVGIANTGGVLNLIGKAGSQEIDIKAAGEFKGENLVGEKVDIKLNGGGNANVFARKYVNATVRAGGNIYIYGDPEQVDEKTAFGGSIKKIN